jgi:hypothetical protein
LHELRPETVRRLQDVFALWVRRQSEIDAGTDRETFPARHSEAKEQTMNGVKVINIHAIFCDKGMFRSAEEATNWILANGFKADAQMDDEFIYVYEQRPRSDFKMGAFGEGIDFRMITLMPGIEATVGELNDEAKKVEARKEAIATVRKNLPFCKVDDAKRIVTGPVLVPFAVDLQGDFEFPEDIEKAAHQFLEDARNIGEMHTKFGNIGTPVESWILREDLFVDAGNKFKIYPRGTWMMSVKVVKDEVWKDVVDGKLRGFSIGFRGTREAVA